jgi:hypothetical protein
MSIQHEPGKAHYPEPAGLMEEKLIQGIAQLQAHLGLDLLGPRSALALRAGDNRSARQAGGSL